MFCPILPEVSIPHVIVALVIPIVFFGTRRILKAQRPVLVEELESEALLLNGENVLEHVPVNLRKTRNRDSYRDVHVYSAGDKPPFIVTEVKSINAYEDGPVVIIAGPKNRHNTFHLGDTHFLIAMGEPMQCEWEDPSRIRILKDGVVCFDAEIAGIDCDVFSSIGFGGYLEDGSDIYIVAGKGVTVLHDYPENP